MDSLAVMVACALPRVSPSSTRIIHALVESRGTVGQADQFARSVGLRDRHQLRRVLAADGLLCFEDLAAWIRLLGWLLESERSGVALSRGALHAGKDPGPRYRTVKRLTGRTWGETRVLGSAWALLQFTAACETHPAAAGASGEGTSQRQRGTLRAV